MELSKRLKEISSMVTCGGTVADIGTDHGYLAIYLIENQIAQKVIAMDVAKGPLSKAESNIQKAGLTGKIETRLSDGLDRLKEKEADTVVMAGMGGNLIMRLFANGEEVLKDVKEIILSPQSDLELVRMFLMKHSYIIREERMLTEDSKNYVILRVEHGNEQYEKRCELKYGRLLLEAKNPVLFKALKKEQDMLGRIQEQLEDSTTKSALARLEEIRQDLECIAEGLQYYEM